MVAELFLPVEPGEDVPVTWGAPVCSLFVPAGLDRCELLQLSGAAGAKQRFQLPPAVPDLSQQSSVEIKSQHKLVWESRQRSRRSRPVERGDNFIQLLFKVELFFWAWIWSVECEQKASSKPLLSCVRFFLPFFSSPWNIWCYRQSHILEWKRKIKKIPLSSEAGLYHLVFSVNTGASGLHGPSSCQLQNGNIYLLLMLILNVSVTWKWK